jgi:hypothetical protein
MRRLGTQVVLWLVGVTALLLLALWRGTLGATVQLTLGLLLLAGGSGFVVAPLIRHERRPWGRTSFRVGAAVTALGLAVTVLAIWHLFDHARRTLAS